MASAADILPVGDTRKSLAAARLLYVLQKTTGGGDSLVCAWDLRAPDPYLQTVAASSHPSSVGDARPGAVENWIPPPSLSRTWQHFVLRLQLDGSSLFNVTADGVFSSMRWNAAGRLLVAFSCSS
jgi:hypothetical protein